MFEIDDEAKRQLEALQALVCGRDFGGMADFSSERSHVLRLAYSYMRNSKMNFSQCQKIAWEEYRNAVKDCMR